MWNPFRRRGKETLNGTGPAPTPAGPAPAAEPDGKPEGKKPGLLGRLNPFKRKPKDKGKDREKTPPKGGGGGGEGRGEGGEAPPEKGGGGGGEKQYPSGLGVSASGVWQISSTEWYGIMHGVLHGDDVVTFMDAMDAEDHAAAAELVAKAYDENVGNLIDTSRSDIHHIGY